jgi:hypothetical protein
MKTKRNRLAARTKPRCILVPADFSESSLAARQHTLTKRTHGRTSLQRDFICRVAGRVLCLAACSVLVVR